MVVILGNLNLALRIGLRFVSRFFIHRFQYSRSIGIAWRSSLKERACIACSTSLAGAAACAAANGARAPITAIMPATFLSIFVSPGGDRLHNAVMACPFQPVRAKALKQSLLRG
jgi:hypothetical protein